MDSTKTQALDAALATLPPSPYLGAPPTTVDAALGDLNAYARERGRLLKLERDGEWFCLGCGVACPFHASLHCPVCLQDWRNRRVAGLLQDARRSDEDRRWEGMARNIASDSRMTQELATSLVAKARELPSRTGDRINALNLAFDHRFNLAAPGASWGTYAGQPETDPAEEWDRG